MSEAPIDELTEHCALCFDPRYVGLLCRRHYHRLSASLSEIRTLAGLLPYHNAVRGGESRSATRTGSPAPGNLDAMAYTDRRAYRARDMREAGDVTSPEVLLEALAETVLIDRNPEAEIPWRIPILDAVRILERERHWLAHQDELVADAIDDIEIAHRTLARITGGGMWPKPVGDCPRCGLPLYVTTGMDSLRCTRCKSVWTGLDLLRMEHVRRQEAERAMR